MTDPSPASPYRLGTRRGLEACASPRGTYAVLALHPGQAMVDPADLIRILPAITMERIDA